MSLDIPQIVSKARGARGPLYLATIVDTEGPSYRRIGGRLLVGERGRLAGSISGGCLERDLVRRIAWLAEGGPRVLTYDTAADGDEEGRAYLGCGGTIHVLLERADRRTLELLDWVSQRSGPCAIATVLESDDPGCKVGDKHAADGDDRSPPPSELGTACDAALRECLASRAHLQRTLALPNGSARMLIEHVPAPRRLLVAGRHYDTGPLVRLAMEAGWHVCVAAEPTDDDLGTPNDRAALTEPALAAWITANPRGAMVIMTHSVALDRLCLRAVLRADSLPYVAVLGPVARTRKLLAAIAEQEALPERAVSQLRSPAGLALGGEGAGAVALSIVAELEQLFGRRTPKL
jgi:xanthine/CO dehydrogenase XdhC/CoxF family maturation factor